ncbi:MAG: UDP-N-acetylmuramate--L-alanine ligase [bacterium ADurb.Bin400]|nr:MAG: UDP-N-acetylmuramate--L-alanine ligase [bacterium ADurb.Bin400]
MKYHFIGDQGVSMKGLKAFMEHLGCEVSGSDLKTTGHRAENVSPDVNVVVRTSAVAPGSPGWVEVEAAISMGITVIKRSELLGEITRNMKLIAVSGMHGKTTITSLAGLLLVEAKMDPTVLVGEDVEAFDGVLRIGHSPWFVAEACEYDRSFLDLQPQILILTNIEEEHLDTYPKGLPEIMDTFRQYISRVREGGVVIACADDENVNKVLSSVQPGVSVIRYGFKSDRYNRLDYSLSVPGQHNIQNALAVTALADYLKIPSPVVERVLKSFHGAHRRFEYKGNYHGADLIDDYGHHPTEIKATLQALAERYSGKRKIVVFWPHQYKRIKPLLEQFGEAFNQADEVIIKPIFLVPGRDEKLDVSSEDVVARVKRHNISARVIETDKEIEDYLVNTLDSQSVLLTIGIPPVYKISDSLMAKKLEQETMPFSR